MTSSNIIGLVARIALWLSIGSIVHGLYHEAACYRGGGTPELCPHVPVESTVAPMANDEGMELARPTSSGHDLTTCGMLEMGQDVHVSMGSLIVCDGLNNPKGVKLECGSIYACRESGGTLKVAGVVTYEMDCTFVREDIERHWNEYPACK